jgi:hypothetical protein
MEEAPEVVTNFDSGPPALDLVVSAALVPSIRQSNKRRTLVEISMCELTANLITRISRRNREESDAFFGAI